MPALPVLFVKSGVLVAALRKLVVAIEWLQLTPDNAIAYMNANASPIKARWLVCTNCRCVVGRLGQL